MADFHKIHFPIYDVCMCMLVQVREHGLLCVHEYARVSMGIWSGY